MLKYCSSEKKLVKLLKIALLGPYLGKNWANIDYAQNQAQFFCGNNKRRSQTFKNFLFYQNIMSFD